MTTTAGLVQQLTIRESGYTCVFIGPAPNNVEAFMISPVLGETMSGLIWKNSMVSALVAATANRQKVWVTHDDNYPEITAVMLGGPFPW
jgi:hypothetical protein